MRSLGRLTVLPLLPMNSHSRKRRKLKKNSNHFKPTSKHSPKILKPRRRMLKNQTWKLSKRETKIMLPNLRKKELTNLSSKLKNTWLKLRLSSTKSKLI
mgnify:CR=1 FL=1